MKRMRCGSMAFSASARAFQSVRAQPVAAVADAVVAGDDRDRPRVGGEDGGQRRHELREAAMRLHPARRVGDETGALGEEAVERVRPRAPGAGRKRSVSTPSWSTVSRSRKAGGNCAAWKAVGQTAPSAAASSSAIGALRACSCSAASGPAGWG